MNTSGLIAGVELGGTKSVTVLARGRDVLDIAQYPTTTPEQTLGLLGAQLRRWNASEQISALGIAAFGPVRLDPRAPDYATMLATPKQAWAGANIGEALAHGLACPWHIDTDVNGAALAEWAWGAAQGHDVVCYLTVGTGLGGGVLIDGKPLHGTLHPELGHLRLRRAAGDVFQGVCPFHGDCIEGLISGPALSARFGCPTDAVSDSDPRWATVASDLAELLAALALSYSPGRILIGGGVGLSRPQLLDLVRPVLVERLAGYLPGVTHATVRTLVGLAGLGANAGPLGAIALGHLALGCAPSSAVTSKDLEQ